MNYVDFTLVRLAHEKSRTGLFDQDSLEQLLFTAYDADAMSLGGPYTASFEQFFTGLPIPPRSTIDGLWGQSSGGERNEGRFTLYGLGADPGVRVDALWRGAIVARSSLPSAMVSQIVSAWPDPDSIDDEIAAAQGTLPTEPAQLEAARRARYLQRLRAVFRQKDALSDAWFDRWLAQMGASSVSDLLTRLKDQLFTGAYQARFSAPANTSPVSRAMPITAALLVRDMPLNVAQLLADTQRVRESLDMLGLERPRSEGAVVRHPMVVAWVVPDNTFEDSDWPGGEDTREDAATRRRRRRLAAGEWLARAGIGLITVPGRRG